MGWKFEEVAAKTFQKIREAVGPEEVDVFGEEGEDAAHQERRHGFGRVILFERSGEIGEERGDLAGDTGRDAAGVERERVEPDGAQAVSDGLVFELLKQDAVGERVGERDVGFAGAGKVGEDLDGVADVHDDQEGRPAIGGGERLCVLLGLIAGAEHGKVPARGSANGGPAAMRRFEEQRGLGSLAALLGLKDETAALVEIDAAGAG